MSDQRLEGLVTYVVVIKTNSVMKNAYVKNGFLCTIEEWLYVPK